MEKSLNVYPSTVEQTRHLLAHAAQRGDTTGGAASIEDVCEGGECFAVTDSTGQEVGAYVLSVNQRAKTRVCWIKAAFGKLPGVDLTEAFLPVVERQARTYGAGQVAITTRRSGLIKKLKARGYRVTGVTLRKAI